MFKQKVILDVKGNDERIHRYECDPDAPIGEIYDALCTMKNFVIEKIKEKGKPLEEESKECESCEEESEDTKKEE